MLLCKVLDLVFCGWKVLIPRTIKVALSAAALVPLITHLRREHTFILLRNTYTMGFFACITSVLTGAFGLVWLLVDAAKYNFANEDVTVNQRTLISANVYAISMFVVGAFAFSYFETWDYGSSYLFCIAALTTIVWSFDELVRGLLIFSLSLGIR